MEIFQDRGVWSGQYITGSVTLVVTTKSSLGVVKVFFSLNPLKIIYSFIILKLKTQIFLLKLFRVCHLYSQSLTTLTQDRIHKQNSLIVVHFSIEGFLIEYKAKMRVWWSGTRPPPHSSGPCH